jgi:hypothetical protein
VTKEELEAELAPSITDLNDPARGLLASSPSLEEGH